MYNFVHTGRSESEIIEQVTNKHWYNSFICQNAYQVCHGIFSTLRSVSPVAILHVPDELELLQGDVEVGVLELRGQLVLLKLLKPVFLQ
jgi:hypothetical protein